MATETSASSTAVPRGNVPGRAAIVSISQITLGTKASGAENNLSRKSARASSASCRSVIESQIRSKMDRSMRTSKRFCSLDNRVRHHEPSAKAS
nr:MAG: hypothetical protein [Apis mellifera filamentous virus]